jgi:uncharacterized protein
MARVVRLLSCLVGVSTAFIVLASSAWAHVTVNAVDATQGAYTVLTFQVPTESDKASTVGVQVELPEAMPLAEVLDQPHPGWTFSSQTKRLTTPITTDDGVVNQAISEVEWKATGGGIKPGQFDQFVLSVGPLPNAPAMTFKVVQSYSDGTQVSWIEVPAPGSSAEPEHPAPVLKLSAASTGSTSSGAGGSVVTAEPKKQSQTVPVVLGVVALVVAVAAAVAAGLALVRSRRRTEERA